MSKPAPALNSSLSSTSRVPIREGLLSSPLDDLSAVRLMGSRCTACGETALGTTNICTNCGKDTVTPLPLSKHGRVWTFTVARHKPPGDYKGPDPFVPFAMGLIEMPEGLRVLAPIDCDLNELKIGLDVEFHAFVRTPQDSGPQVVSFVFAPSGAGESRV